MVTRKVLLGISLALLVGCSATNTDLGSSSEQIYTRTIVHIGADGVATQRVFHVTAAQQEAEKQALANGTALLGPGASGGTTSTESVIEDDSCAASDMHLWDSTNETGDELCLSIDSNYSTASLNDFQVWYGQGWGGQVESFTAGQYAGTLSVSGGCQINFTATETDSNTDACYAADTIFLYVPPN